MQMKIKRMVRGAFIGAIYATVSVALAPISYGMLQVRVSEALTLLPVFSADAVVGVTLGCFLANLIGMFMGANILGPLDVIIGTAATLAAALCTRALRNKSPWLAALPPVFINALVVGGELTFVMGAFSLKVFAIQFFWVALGQACACFVLGVPLTKFLQKNSALCDRAFKD
ncbi:MAG: QueT transporter family protein [Oscillospiraceae bacterium]